jgi:asparagine synthase (glutamine-hydrolysing)
MCGLFGELTWGQAAPAPPPPLDPVLAALAHRGPDAHGILVTEGAGWRGRLAHTRLKIIDLSDRAAQPMSSGDGRLSLVFNGEIYNYRRLRTELAAAGLHFRSDSDTEVLLAALQAWGEHALQRLDGIFSFALLDRRDGTMLAARDRLGVKPLYYLAADGLLAVASEVRALLACGRHAFRADPDAMASFLAFGSVSGPGTACLGIRELRPGHLLRLKQGRLVEEPYWTLPGSPARAAPGSEAEAAQRIHDQLSRAVQDQLVADVPVGVFLSGGMDSGALVALASEHRGGDVDAFTVGLPSEDRSLDESAQASSQAGASGARHHLLVLTPDDALASLEEWFEALDQPSIDGFNSFIVSREVRRAGVTVALSGTGADELFGGYPHLRRTRAQRLTLGALRACGGLFRPGALAWRALSGRDTRLDKLLLMAGSSDEAGLYAAQRALLVLQAMPALVAPSLRPAWCAQDARRFLSGHAEGAAGPAAQRLLELQNYLPNTLLRDADVMSMWHGLEVRVPFLDHALVELMLALPPEWNVRPPQIKPLLAAAMGGRIPAARRKLGFNLPFARWLRGPLRADVERRFGRLEWAGQFLTVQGVAPLWRRLLGGEDRAWTRVWAIYVLDRWLERQVTRSSRLALASRLP